jgi:hypothetical protein
MYRKKSEMKKMTVLIQFIFVDVVLCISMDRFC